MKVVVLGGHGFIGRRVSERLAAEGHAVSVLSRSEGIDLAEYGPFRDALAGLAPEAIVNAAAHVGSLHYVTEHAADVAHDNLQMELNLYRAVREVVPAARVVNPIANCSYPGAAEVYRESEYWNGEVHRSVYSYGNARRMEVVLAHCYAWQYGVRSVNFLVPNTFGPGDHVDPNRTHALNGMIIRMIAAHKEEAPEFVVWGTGNPVREWVYVDDVVQILVEGLTTAHELVDPVNLGQARGYSIRESAEMIAEAIGYLGELRFDTRYQDGAPVKIMADDRFRELFPDFRFTDHRQGIASTVRYYEQVLAGAPV